MPSSALFLSLFLCLMHHLAISSMSHACPPLTRTPPHPQEHTLSFSTQEDFTLAINWCSPSSPLWLHNAPGAARHLSVFDIQTFPNCSLWEIVHRVSQMGRRLTHVFILGRGEISSLPYALFPLPEISSLQLGVPPPPPPLDTSYCGQRRVRQNSFNGGFTVFL